MQSWASSVQIISDIAKAQPQMAHCAYICTWLGKQVDLLQAIPNISNLFQPLENVLFLHFIPALIGKPISDLEHSLFILPVCLGGLGICDPQTLANSEFAALVKVIQLLVNCILHQYGTFNTDITAN